MALVSFLWQSMAGLAALQVTSARLGQSRWAKCSPYHYLSSSNKTGLPSSACSTVLQTNTRRAALQPIQSHTANGTKHLCFLKAVSLALLGSLHSCGRLFKPCLGGLDSCIQLRAAGGCSALVHQLQLVLLELQLLSQPASQPRLSLMCGILYWQLHDRKSSCRPFDLS